MVLLNQFFFTVRTKENKYLIHNDDFMIMDDNNHFHKVSLESVFANSKMIPSSSYNSSIEQTLLNLNYRQKDSTVMIIPLNTFYYNNELWIVTSYGIIVLNSDLITGVENTSFENQIVVFPNPAQDILNISSELQGKDFEIIDVLGQVVQSGKAESTQINLEKMSSGTYLLNFPNSNIKTISFIIIK